MVCDKLEEIGYEGATCVFLSMTRNIYSVGEKEESVELVKSKNVCKEKSEDNLTKGVKA